MITLEFEQLLIRKYKIRYMRDFMWPKKTKQKGLTLNSKYSFYFCFVF